MNFSQVVSEKDVQSAIGSGSPVAVYMWGEWSDTCQKLEGVLAKLHQRYSASVTFLRVAAEDAGGLVEAHNVEAVPHFLFFNGGKLHASVPGAQPALLASTLDVLSTSKSVPAASASAASSTPQQTDDNALEQRLQKLINYAPVMLFMKGSPSQPRCKFSRATIDLLKSVDAEYSSFDILSDDSVRQGLKNYSNWPTYPQLYIDGKLIGGLDILKEMNEDEELAPLLASKKGSSQNSLEKRLASLIAQAPVMLFMKGHPEQPQCKFSRAIVELLNKEGIQFSSFNILADEEVRQGLKTYSNWPTFPQLYAHQKLIGGLDIVRELVEDGELHEMLKIK